MTTYTVEPELAQSLNYSIDPELDLLDDGPLAGESRDDVSNTSPIFTGDAFEHSGPNVFPQRALYGRILQQHMTGFPIIPQVPKLYMNTNAPFSGLVCGVQGSGKSHTTAVLLESCLIRDKRLGTLPAPLSVLLFHFDPAAGKGRVCEAAYVGSLDKSLGGNAAPPKVTVLVLPNSVHTMRQAYAEFPGITVQPLYFASEDISSDRLLAMMKTGQGQSMPLYMECIMDIVRSMEIFKYEEFLVRIKEKPFAPSQKAMLNLRLGLLSSCIQGDSSNSVSKHFVKGQLTIIDLSSPLMDSSSACGFFDIILSLFTEARTEATGKLVVLDEAHKYLANSGTSARLTESLLSLIRQQRHLAMRVLISTQEPTVVPARFIDLCSFIVVHRFSSPAWLEHLKQHVPAIDPECFSKVVNLRIGEAIIFASAGVGLRHYSREHGQVVVPFGQGYILVRSRKRITKDGGRSLLAAPESSTLPLKSLTLPDPGMSSISSPANDAEHSDSPLEGIEAYLSSAPSTPVIAKTSPGLSDHSSNSPWELETQRDRACSSTPTTDDRWNAAVERKWDQYLSLVEPRFRPLATLLHESQERGQPRLTWTQIGIELKQQHPPPYYGKLRQYLDDAVEERLVKVGVDVDACDQWVQLSPHRSAPRKHAALVAVLRSLLDAGEAGPARSVVAQRLYEKYPNAITGKFKRYAQEAEAAGIIRCDMIGDGSVRLVPNLL